MPRTSARHQRDLALFESAAQHKGRGLAKTHDVGMRRAEASEAFMRYVVDGVDQLFHPILPISFVLAIFDQPCDLLREFAQQRVELVIFLFAAEIGQHQREPTATLALFQQQ
jgi:hypothetical protein